MAIEGGVDDVGGTPIERARRDAVVLFGTGRGGCTGTLIAPGLVLTAHHCTWRAAPSGWVGFGAEDRSALTTVDVRACIPGPGAARCGCAAGTCPSGVKPQEGVDYTYDVALLVLEQRVDAHPTTGMMRATFAATPAGVALTDPPGGPSAWIGQTLTAVGWGLMSAGGSFATVRQRLDVTVTSVPGHDLNISSPSTHQGDSGGPSYIGDPASGPISVLGVHQRETSDDRLTDASIAAFIDACLSVGSWDGFYFGPTDVPLAGEPGRTTSHDAIDQDGDGLTDEHDNCPDLFNPTQRDADHDGMGDRCDFCGPTTVDRDFVDEDADGFNDLTCDRDCPESDEGVDTDGDEIPDARLDTDGDGISDACDQCAEIPDRRDPRGAPMNCNLDSEIAEGIDPPIPDACDPTPCPDSVREWRLLEDGVPPLVSTRENTHLELTGRGRPEAWAATAEAGLRFCPCTLATVDTPETRALCAGLAETECVIEPELFEVEDKWHMMTFSDASPECAMSSYGDLRCTLGYSVSSTAFTDWDFRANAAAWSVPIDAGPLKRMNGVLWTHTEGALTSCPPPLFTCGPVAYEERLASHYWSGQIRWEPSDTTIPEWEGVDPILPFYPSFFPPEDCPTCDFPGRLPWLVADPCLRLGGCGIEEARIRHPAFDRPATELIEDAGLVAGRDGWLLAIDATAFSDGRPIFIALSEEMEIQAVLGRDESGRLGDASASLEGIPPIPASSEPWPSSFATHVALYRAMDLAVYILGVPAGPQVPAAELWRLDIVSGVFGSLRFESTAGAITGVYAVAFRPQDRQLYAVIQIDGEIAYLARVPLSNGAVELLAFVGGDTPEYEQHALMFDSNGDVMLMGYGDSGLHVVRVAFDDLAGAGEHLDSPDVLLMAPLHDGEGVSFLASDPELGGRAGGFGDDALSPHQSFPEGLVHAF